MFGRVVKTFKQVIWAQFMWCPPSLCQGGVESRKLAFRNDLFETSVVAYNSNDR